MSANLQIVPELPVLTNGEFERFQRLIHREAGIYLGETKHALLIGRLARRVRELGLQSFTAYYRAVEGDRAELVQLLDAIATNETYFFREPQQFEVLERQICDEWRAAALAGARPRRVRIWSAACSTGEEPYSLAMVLHRRLALEGWAISILASDLSTRALRRAQVGTWPLERTRGIPERYLRAYMLRGIGPEAGNARVGPEVRDLVTFARINLADDPYPVTGPFDAIFCRNVLIYFDAASRRRVIERLRGYLAPGGFLFLGHAESLAGWSEGVQSILPAVYRLTGPTAAPSAA